MEKFVSTMYDAITQGMEKKFPERVAFRYYTEETDTVTTVLFKELAQDVRRTVTCLQSTQEEKSRVIQTDNSFVISSMYTAKLL